MNYKPVKTEWLDDGHRMRLLESVSFCDNKGVIWKARAGMVFDGASIPRIAWRFIGSPFVGKYRRAAVVHDQYYKYGLGQEPLPDGSSIRPREDVDQVFYDIMILDGVRKWKAKLMYRTVRMFGPRF